MDSLPFRYPTWALVVGSIATTVVLVMVNKMVFVGGFPYVLALSTFHFIATYGLMAIMSHCLKLFEPKFLVMPTNLIVGSVGVASICFSNYSLQFNSVGTYQMAKLCVIPVVLFFNALQGQFASRKVHSALVVILTGVGAATVTDVQLNSKGLFFAGGAVLATAQYQIWQGSKQKEGGLNEMQMSMSVSYVQMLVAGFLSVVLEFPDMREKLIENPDENMRVGDLVFKILASCLLAVSANVHSFALIGRTSAVTFQVVGHGKTCLILIAGYILFPLPTLLDLLYNVTGVSLAVFGVIVYSNLKLNEPTGTKDWCDLYMPGFVLSCLKPSDYTKVPTIPEGDVESKAKSASPQPS